MINLINVWLTLFICLIDFSVYVISSIQWRFFFRFYLRALNVAKFNFRQCRSSGRSFFTPKDESQVDDLRESCQTTLTVSFKTQGNRLSSYSNSTVGCQRIDWSNEQANKRKESSTLTTSWQSMLPGNSHNTVECWLNWL